MEATTKEELSDWVNKWEIVSKSIINKNTRYTSISVFNPEKVGESTFSKGHIVYTVRTEPYGYVVRRRFKEFKLLRDCLTRTYSGLFIPALPNEPILSTNILSGNGTDVDSDFIRNRTIQLNFFVSQISVIPFLLTSGILKSFLSLQDDFMNVDISVCEPNASEGEQTWKLLIDSYILPLDADRILSDIKRQINSLHNSLAALEVECLNLSRAASTYSRQLRVTREKLQSWYEAEKDIQDPTKNEVPNTHPALASHLSALDESFAYWTSTAQSMPKIITWVLIANVQFQLVQLEGFRSYLRHRESLAQQLQQLERERAQQQQSEVGRDQTIQKNGFMETLSSFSIQSLQTMFSSTGPESAEERTRQRNEQLDTLTLNLNVITKAVLFCEAERFQNERAISIKNLVGLLLSIQCEDHQAGAKQWEKLARTHGINPHDFADRMQAILARNGDTR